MKLTRNQAAVSILGMLIILTGPVDAAKPNAKAKGMNTINGMVVNHKKKPVAGAHVHVEGRHKSHHGAALMAKMKAVKPKPAGAMGHHGVMTAANGTFSMKHHHSGTVTLVAHKKGVGTGHARVTLANAANVMIRLHKHHHHHGK